MSINLIMTHSVFYTQVYHFILHSYVFGQLSLSLYSFFKKTQLNNEAGTLNYPSFSEFIFIKVMYIVHLPRFINSLKYLQNVIPVELLCTVNYFLQCLLNQILCNIYFQ